MRKYTVVVKELTDNKGNFNRQRFNNVKPNIIKFLLKHNFSFKVAIANGYINVESAKNYIEIFLKEEHTFFAGGKEKALKNALSNYKLLKKLGGNPREPEYLAYL